ncbi:DHA2 family efflux MFS transporter permease subunit [Phenylobacterium sp.]|uniref:DHA2 family efflux MFS transporter permease subunit n=1 Tax=Phenylobacterium sp. TaxID=1871053 RepID=UPI002DE8BBFA|nr:DHA2 family efflux MFS transporter permease subunit [Phenylobacterium sp.]
MSEAKDTANRWPITISIMLATVMNSLDTTIANVALPHIQGSVSASSDQITWVLTSYIVSAAIMTPLSGWLADRVGRKRIFLLSIGGFTIASMLCGIASSLPEIVIFRLLQGVAGAALIPLSQAVLLDINPREKHGQAMAMWGAGALLGPILGPALGGYLTDNFSWRWCFYINLPVGILAFLGVWFFISGDRNTRAKPFDFLGFGMLTVFVGSMQLLLDRGPSQDWFASSEITTYAILGAISAWVFVSHTLTATHPFFDRRLAGDRNFVTASAFGFFVGVLLFSTMALLPPMLQGLMGYPVLTSGLVTMPRGLGTWVAMIFVGRLVGRVDTRLLLVFGLSMNALALYQMVHFDLSMSPRLVIISGVIQGFGLGFLFVPLSTLAFASLPPVLRPEGSSLYTLIRNLGSSVGISVMEAQVVSQSAAAHAGLAGNIDMSNPVVRATLAPGLNPATTAGAMALNNEVTRQGAMVAYVGVFHILFYITLACIPMLLLMRPPRREAGGEPLHVAVE